MTSQVIRFIAILLLITCSLSWCPATTYARKPATEANTSYFLTIKHEAIQKVTNPTVQAEPDAVASPTPTLFMPTVTPMVLASRTAKQPISPYQPTSPSIPSVIIKQPIPTQKMPEPSATLIPTQIPQNDELATIMLEVNTYRLERGLPAVRTQNTACQFAQTRSEEITRSFTHDAFYKRINTHTLPYKTWSKVTENLAEAVSYKDVVSMWKNSPKHASNMREDTPFVCIRKTNNFYAYEGLKP